MTSIEERRSESLKKSMENISIITQSTQERLKWFINDRETVWGPLTVIVYDRHRAIVKNYMDVAERRFGFEQRAEAAGLSTASI